MAVELISEFTPFVFFFPFKGNVSDASERFLGSNTVMVVASDNGGAPWFGGLNAPLR